MNESIDQPRSDAQAVFLELIELAPEDPGAALSERNLPEPLRGRVERMVAAYLRTRRLERELIATDGEIARAIAEAELLPASAVDRTVPDRLGGYRIERVLGEGPNAVVLLAQQETPIERSVAIKLLFADASDPRVAARAELERQILASLEHPNIARIYDFGIDSRSRPYLVMEYVRGGAVDAWCRGRNLAEREIVGRVYLGIASAIRFAHAHGVLHRDIKCANALVQVVDGEPHAKVIDFGIARALGGALAERAGLAELPRAIGTLASMSPEALDPAAPQLDARSDVFGLGIVLFELVAGRPARNLEGGDLAAALRALVDQPIPRVRALVPTASRDIDAIVAKATAGRPDARYQTVAALVSDIEEYLAGREVSARPRSMTERAALVVRRRWRIGLAAALVAVSAVTWLRHESQRGRAKLDTVVTDAISAIGQAKAIRNSAGRGAERDTLVARALDATKAAGLIDPDSAEVRELRASALEEAIIPRLVRGEHKSRELVALVDEFVALREALAEASEDSPQALERLSVALAYQCDTVRFTDRQAEVENRQIALDESLHASYPDSLVFADNLCWTYQRVSHDMWMRGERARSREILRRSSAIGEAILERHGRTPMTLYTATSAAIYGAWAAGPMGELDGFLAGMQRARAVGAELLAASPDHFRGASFLLRAGLGEASEWIDRREYARAEAALAESRKAAAHAVTRERGIGFLGFPLADSLCVSARVALLRGDIEGAKTMLAQLRSEIDAERATLERERIYAGIATARDVLGARIAVAEGRSEEGQAMLRAIAASLRRLPAPSGDLDISVDAIVAQLLEMPKDALAEDLAAAIGPILTDSEVTEDGRRRARSSRSWFEFARGNREGTVDAIAHLRAQSDLSPGEAYEAFRLERALREMDASGES